MGNKYVGFDFGESRIKMVQYDGKKVQKAVWADIPYGMMMDGQVIFMDAMADFIAEVAKENGFSKGAASVVLPSPNVYTKILSMPVMTHQQVLYNLPFEFSDFLTEDKSAYFFDYMILGTEEDEEGNVTEMRMFACCAMKDVINTYRSMFRRAGYRMKLALPMEYAYSRLVDAFITRNEITEEKDYCIVDLGHTETRVLVFHGNEHVQRSNIELGMRGLSKLIGERLQISEITAESYKRINNNRVLEAQFSLDYYDSIAVEIMKTVNFYNYNNRDAEIQTIYLAGGGAAIPQFGERIAEITGLSVANVSGFLPESEAFDQPELYTLACGCTL